MSYADHVLATWPSKTDDFPKIMAMAERIVISDEAFAFAKTMKDNVDLSYALLPQYPCWVEFEADVNDVFAKIGFLFVEPLHGLLMYTSEGKRNTFPIHSIFNDQLGTDTVSEFIDKITRQPVENGRLLKPVVCLTQDVKNVKDGNSVLQLLMDIVSTVLVLMKSPKVISSRTFTPDEKKNRHNISHGRPAMMSYRDVVLSVDTREAIRDGAVYRSAGEKAPASSTGAGKALHHVRPFWRTKRGKLELVRGHWRGNPDLGIIKHNYQVVK